MPTQKPRYMITVDEELSKRIIDYRFEKRYNSISQAIVDLVCIAFDKLDHDEQEQDT